MIEHERPLPAWLEPLLKGDGPAIKQLRKAIAHGVDRGTMYTFANDLRSLNVPIEDVTVGDLLGFIQNEKNEVTISIPYASDQGVIVLCFCDSPVQQLKQRAFQLIRPGKSWH